MSPRRRPAPAPNMLGRAFSLDGAGHGSRRDGTRTEMELVKAILGYLSARRIRARKVNVGLAVGRSGLYKYGQTGEPDVQGIIPPWGGMPWGVPLYIEVKRPGAEPEPHQVRYMAQLRWQGALVFCAHSIAETEAALDAAGVPRGLLPPAKPEREAEHWGDRGR